MITGFKVYRGLEKSRNKTTNFRMHSFLRVSKMESAGLICEERTTLLFPNKRLLYAALHLLTAAWIVLSTHGF